MLDLRSSVYAKAILFMAIVFVALIGTDLWQSLTARDTRLQEARTETDNLARSLAQYAQDVFETTDATILGLRTVVAATGMDPAEILRLDERMHSLVASQKLFRGLALFDEHGDWIASSLDPASFEKLRHLSFANRDFFQNHRDNAEDVATIGLPVQAKSNGAWLVVMSRRLYHPDGSFAGVVDATISVDLFQNFFATFDIGQEGAISLATGEGAIMIRRPFDPANVGRDVGQSQFFTHVQAAATAGTFDSTSMIDGRPRLGSFHRVGGLDLVIIVALDKNELLAGWWHETELHLVWLAITILFVATLGYRLAVQIRDRVNAETVAQELQLDAHQRDSLETERRAYERELEQQKRELQRSNAALEQFAYAASHDLQSPLRAIGHLAQWIDEDLSHTATADTRGNLKLLHGRVTRLQMLITGLLAYARVGRASLQAEEVNVAAVVQDIISVLEPHPNFVVEYAGEVVLIRTHRAPLELILKNLISNAIQHHDRAEGHVVVTMETMHGMAEFRIADDGPGIAERYHEDIFVIFKTLQSRDEAELGGIGLAMVKKQVMENGGRIWVESAPPTRGASFVFTWKLVPM